MEDRKALPYGTKLVYELKLIVHKIDAYGRILAALEQTGVNKKFEVAPRIQPINSRLIMAEVRNLTLLIRMIEAVATCFDYETYTSSVEVFLDNPSAVPVYDANDSRVQEMLEAYSELTGEKHRPNKVSREEVVLVEPTEEERRQYFSVPGGAIISSD